MLRVVIYRDIQRVNCSYKHFVQLSLPSMKDLNAMPMKGAWKYVGSKQHCRIFLLFIVFIIMNVIFAMLPSKEIILLLLLSLSINFRGW